VRMGYLPARRWLRTVLLSGALIVYGAAGIWTQLHFTSRLPSDLDIYLNSGHKALAGLDPYQPYQIGASFVYPPVALLLFGPLSTFSATAAHRMWAVVSLSAYLAVLLIAWRGLTPGRSVMPPPWSIVILLFFAPLWETVSVGQVNSLVLLGITLFALGMVNHRYAWLGDMGLVFAIAVKISPIVLLALPLVLRDWPRVIRIVLGLAVLALLSFLAYGAVPWLGFVRSLPTLLQGYPGLVNEAITPSAQWLLSRVAPGQGVGPLSSVISVIALTIWTAVLLTRGQVVDRSVLLAFGLVTMTLSSSLIWYHHLLFLVLPLTLLLWNQTPRIARNPWLILLASTAVCLIQVNRFIEKELHLPPFAAILGYLSIYLAIALYLLLTGVKVTRPAPEGRPDQASPLDHPVTNE
jgi:hypothetical protein